MEILPQNKCREFEGEFQYYNETLNLCHTASYSLKGNAKIISHVLCAKNPEIGRATCSGDSGGPLTVVVNGSHVLVGITNAGYGCGLVSFLYSRV